MNTVLLITGIVTLGFVVNIALKQSYNFIFFLARRPYWWIISAGMVAIAVWALSAGIGWGVSVPTWACTIALLMNLPPSQKNAETKRAIQVMTNEVYAEMGIRHGLLLYRLGLAVFVIVCLASWVIFYGEVCSGGECRGFINIVF